MAFVRDFAQPGSRPAGTLSGRCTRSRHGLGPNRIRFATSSGCLPRRHSARGQPGAARPIRRLMSWSGCLGRPAPAMVWRTGPKWSLPRGIAGPDIPGQRHLVPTSPFALPAEMTRPVMPEGAGAKVRTPSATFPWIADAAPPSCAGGALPNDPGSRRHWRPSIDERSRCLDAVRAVLSRRTKARRRFAARRRAGDVLRVDMHAREARNAHAWPDECAHPGTGAAVPADPAGCRTPRGRRPCAQRAFAVARSSGRRSG